MSTETRLRRIIELLDRETEAGRALLAEPPASPPEVDLRTLLAEMIALKAEIRAETRSTRDQRDEVSAFQAELSRALHQAQSTAEATARRAARERREHVQQTARLLIDLADRLEATLAQAQRLARPRGFLLRRRADAAAESLRDGLRLTCKRLADRLSGLGALRIRTLRRQFDPHLMQATGTVWRPWLAEGVVVSEITAGYRLDDTVLRPAEVTVNIRERASR